MQDSSDPRSDIYTRRVRVRWSWLALVATSACGHPSPVPPPYVTVDPAPVDARPKRLRPVRMDVTPPDRPATPLSCPPMTEDLDQSRVTLDAAVLFATDAATLQPAAEGVLAELVASQVAPFPKVRLRIEGHTDDRGSTSYNARLSRRRADAVAAWLTAHGIERDRVQTEGLGETRPVGDNATEPGRAANRRVEVVLRGMSEGGQCGDSRACCLVDTPACIGADLTATSWQRDADRHGVEVSERVVRLCEVSEIGQAVWVTSTGENKIAKFEAATGRELFRVPTFGKFPQRTAIAPDGSVWITNRESGSYIHLAPDGSVRCASEYGTCVTRAAAVDPDGHAWIGCHDDKTVRRVDAVRTEGEVMIVDDPGGEHNVVPRCAETAQVQLRDTAPYGLASDADGGMWVTSNLGTTVAKIDTHRAARIAEFDVASDPFLRRWGGCFSPYGITIDRDGNPWLGNYLCGTVLKMDGSTGRILGSFGGGKGRRLQRPRAVGLDRDGNVWVAENEGTHVVKLSPRGGFLRRVDLSPCGGADPGPLGTGSDAEGHMWTVLHDAGKLVRYTTEGEILGCYPEGDTLRAPYTYSDLTGSLLSLVTRDTGRVRARVQAPAPTQWRMLTARVSTPGGSRACLRVRAAPSELDLAKAAWSGRACPSAGTLSPRRVALFTADRSGPTGRVLEVELTLSPGIDGSLPTFADASVAGIPAP